MDLVARKKLNLEVLKRHDTNICDILDQSAHAVVYKFDTEKTSWVKFTNHLFIRFILLIRHVIRKNLAMKVLSFLHKGE